MSRSIRTVVFATALGLVLSPTVAMGQMTPRRDNNPFAGKPGPIAPVNVARTAIEHERDLALTDSQRTQIVMIQRRLDSATAPLVKKLDSLRPTWRPAGGPNDLTPEQREQLATLRAAQGALVDSLTPTFTKARDEVMALLRPEQKERVAKLERQARKRAEEQAKRALESPQQRGYDGGRRGRIQDATGRTPLG
jgi:Spy/CpxP family protein refolding chaperone